MKKHLSAILLVFLVLPGCNGDKNPDTSGVVTINNVLEFDSAHSTWVIKGFLFSQGRIVRKLKPTSPGVSIDNDGTLGNLILQEYNLENSFYKAGEFANESQASVIFYNLTSYTVPEWKVWADSLRPNQIWIYKSPSETYAKIRIISTVSETRSGRDYAECTFEWEYQPDGTITWPGK